VGYTFDGENQLIILTTGTTEFSVVDMWSRWCDWHVTNGQYPLAIRYVGADSISETKRLGSTFFLINGWRIRPQEANHRLIVIGNLYTDPAGDSPFVSTVGSFNIVIEMQVSNLSDSTLQQLPDIEYASFNGGATIDFVNGVAGTDGKKGNQQNPVNNLADAKAIIAARGLPKTLFVIGNFTMGETDSVAGYTVIGEDPSSTLFTLTAGNSTIAAKLHNLTITGTCGGRMDMTNCHLKNIVGLCASGGDANIVDSMLMGSIQFKNIADRTFNFVSCYGPSGADALTVDCNGCMADVNFVDWTGTITVENINHADCNWSFNIDSGHLTLGNSVLLAAIIAVSGTAKFTNNTSLPLSVLDTSGLQRPVNEQYGKRIYLSALGSAGSDYPIGLFDEDVASNMMSNNFPDAIVLSEKFNANDFHIHSDITIPSGTVLDYYVMSGHISFTLTFEAGCVTNNLKFEGVTITGVLNGPCEFKNCHLVDVSGVEGMLEHCTYEGTVTAKDGGMLHINGGKSHTQTPVVLSVGTAMINAADLYGMFEIADKTGIMEVNMHFGFGMVTVADSCTEGSIYLAGSGQSIDNSNGAVVVSQMVDPAAGGSLTTEQNTMLTDLHDEALGKWVVDPQGNTLTLYRADGITVLKTFNLISTGNSVPTFIQRTPV